MAAWMREPQGDIEWVNDAYVKAVEAADVAEVCERMRRLQGQWKATPYGETMEIAWPEIEPE